MVDENQSASSKQLESHFKGLWRHPDFMRLWIGQTISEFGSWLGALPLMAILVLDATPVQMGLLETMRSAPALFLGLFAGVWVDRLRRRPILVASDIGRALLLGAIAIAALMGSVRMAHLYIVAFLIGALTMFFNLAYHAYVPILVGRKKLLEANSKLGATTSLAEIASPGLGGVLVELITAPMTLLLDAISYLVSAFFVGLIRKPERIVPVETRNSMWREVTIGLGLVRAHPLLRALAGASATRSFFGGFFAALYGLFVLREIGSSPAMLGLLIGSGGIGSLVGALFIGRFTGFLGWGNALIMASLVNGALALLIPLAGGPLVLAMGMLFIGQIVGDIFYTLYFIGELSLRQSIIPDSMMGRINASFDFLVGGVGTVGIFTGGLLGNFIGLRPATAVAAVGMMLAFLWLFFSPLRGLRQLDSWRMKADTFPSMVSTL
jgi:MFS family permease